MPPMDFTRRNCVVRTEVDQCRLPVLMWYVHLLADPRRPRGTAKKEEQRDADYEEEISELVL